MRDEFTSQVFEYVQDSFARMYRNVHQQFWGNSVYANMASAPYMCNFDVGVAEYYIPTCLNAEGILQYHRVVVSLVPELDEETFKQEVARLDIPFKHPMGVIDSTTILVCSKTVGQQLKSKILKDGKKAFIKTVKMSRCIAFPVICNIPEIVAKKILTIIGNFWNHRVKRFLEKLKIQPYQYDYKLENILFSNYLIENYMCIIKHSLKSMVATLLWLTDRLRNALKRIGTLNLLKGKVLSGLREVVDGEVPLSCRAELEKMVMVMAAKLGVSFTKDYG